MCGISEFITGHASAQPEALALRTANASLNYLDLNTAANRLANHLISLGVGHGVTVALCYDRSFDQIIAALAIMRAGGAYIPIDPAWPSARIQHILIDSGAAVFIAPRELTDVISSGLRALDVQDDAVAIAAACSICVEAAPLPDSLAYLIYTSGSTGTPKGVEITHGNLTNLIAWHCEAFGVTEHDHASHLAGLGFDASVWEVWPYLAAGACIWLADDLVRTSPLLLQQWLVDREITMAFVPTPLAEPMITMNWPKEIALRFLLTGGDTLHATPKAGQPFVVVNNYGPTECTVVATSGIVAADHDGMPTIGRAISGAQVYVLNERGGVAATGETGELFIGGAGVGRGYRNQPELTARCFMPDLFSGTPGGRLYKTGDRAALLANGQIAFRGREDGQEKIRGQRLELDEIVCVLNRHPSVAFSTVAAQGSGAEKHLVAYVLPSQGSTPTARELQDFLAQALPGFMIPAKFVRLESIPLNANGKVDGKLLPESSLENSLTEVSSRPATSPVEETILTIVQTLLQTKTVSVDDDFFLIGGHSLMGTRLVMRVREAFGVNLTLRDLFECGTVALLAAHVEGMLVAELDSMSEEEAEAQAAQ